MTDFAGAALISNTQLYEVGRLLNDKKLDGRSNYVSYYAPKLFDLFTLMESIILNDKLLTLPALITTDKNPFVEQLENLGIVSILDESKDTTEIGKLIIEKFSEIKDYKATVGSREGDVAYINYINEMKLFYSMDDSLTEKFKALKWRLNDTYEASLGGRLNIGDSLEEFCRNLIGYLYYRGSGTYEESTGYLRDMYYIVMAEKHRLPYYPQFSRKEFADKFPNYYDTNFKTKLFERIAKALNATIEEVYNDFADKPVFIPPFSSIILDRADKPENILEQTLELRNEYTATRRGFLELELELTSSQNLKQRLKISRRQSQLLSDAGKSFQQLSKINFMKTLTYIPEVIEPITKPGDPTKYSANLLTVPIELLLEWWRKRPIVKMFTLQDKLLEIKNYPSLINKHFPDFKPR